MVLGLFKSKSQPNSDSRKSSKHREIPSPSQSPRRSSKSPTKSVKEDLRTHHRKLASRSNSRNLLNTDVHPLNLPPEERERRRSAMPVPADTMDVDHEDTDSSAASSPATAPPSAFPDANGETYDTEINSDASPIPPPHRSKPAFSPPPIQQPALDGEACKTLGNKYFKNKDYVKAIAEYTKGEPQILYMSLSVPSA